MALSPSFILSLAFLDVSQNWMCLSAFLNYIIMKYIEYYGIMIQFYDEYDD
jgi:hypothetical protein